jgi:hypothetical protein
MVLNKDFREFLKLLAKHKIKYLIVGGYAVGFHGYPRYTKDLDIWIKPEKKNAEKTLKLLDEFGFGSTGISIDDLNKEGKFILLGSPPNRIDLVTSCDGIEFDECYSQKILIGIGKIKVNFIDLDNLKKNKKAVNRAQDIADIKNLEE